MLTPSFDEIGKLAAQAGHPAAGATGDTPKRQPSEFSFAGQGTDRSRQNKEFQTLQGVQDTIQQSDAKAGGNGQQAAPVSKADVTVKQGTEPAPVGED